jgi:hypothetical protein
MPFDRTNPNLTIWLREMATDPAFEGRPVVKPFTRGGGFKGSAINATYIVMRLTQAFGPVGFGWGYEVLADDVIPGAPVLNKSGVLLGHEQVQRTRIRFWYYPHGRNGERAEFQQVGQTTYVSWSEKFGRFTTDEEAWKKSLTDAITKAASHIGFGADVHIGLWDDNKYVNDRTADSEAQQRALDQAAAAEEIAATKQKAQEIIENLAQAMDPSAITRLRGDAIALRPNLKKHGLTHIEMAIANAIREAQSRINPAAE